MLFFGGDCSGFVGECVCLGYVLQFDIGLLVLLCLDYGFMINGGLFQCQCLCFVFDGDVCFSGDGLGVFFVGLGCGGVCVVWIVLVV